MLLRDNPVLSRELLVNLRSHRAFIIQACYVVFLSAVVFFYWPSSGDSSGQVSSGVARRLFELFFLGQFFLVALVAPSFAAGSITGEKERKTYEMLLASPLRPSTILVGKLLSSLSFLVLLIVSSLPLMILCFLLGGILLSEIARAYLILLLAAGTFGLMSVACSSYFRRTSSALVVSYLIILQLAVACVAMTRSDDALARDFVSVAVLPPWCLAIWT
ncbi:MAG: ABC transporter permease, partial [Isosphaeraceae bacterium]